MRAFISICGLAAVSFAQKRVGDYDYSQGGNDWSDIYGASASACKSYNSAKQSPINIISGSAEADDSLSVTADKYGKSNGISITQMADGTSPARQPAINMQVSFPVSDTQDGSSDAWPAVMDEAATNVEKERLHQVNRDWFEEGGDCDEQCQLAGAKVC